MLLECLKSALTGGVVFGGVKCNVGLGNGLGVCCFVFVGVLVLRFPESAKDAVDFCAGDLA